MNNLDVTAYNCYVHVSYFSSRHAQVVWDLFIFFIMDIKEEKDILDNWNESQQGKYVGTNYKHLDNTCFYVWLKFTDIIITWNSNNI